MRSLCRQSEGSYLVRRSEKSRTEFAISLVGNQIVNHYRLIGSDGEQIAMVDAVNGNTTFPSLQALLSYYKLLNPKTRGGLAARLTLCVPPS